MSNFDIFSFDDEKAAGTAANELEVSFDYDHPYLLNDGKEKQLKLCASIRPSNELRRLFEKNGSMQGTHICLVIDISDSMNVVLDASNARPTGRTSVGEDGKTYNIVEGGISKLHIAVNSAKKIVDLLRPNDTLSCIAYNNDARIIFQNLSGERKSEILSYFDGLRALSGGTTNITKALKTAEQVLMANFDVLPKRILFFTDGEPTDGDLEEYGIAAGKSLAGNNISIESMGFGKDDVNFPFLQKVSAPSGGTVNMINYPDEFAGIFSSLFIQSQSVVITNVKLILKTIGVAKICDYYRGTPDNVYLGDASKSSQRELVLNLGQIEKNQMYKYYFNILLEGQQMEDMESLNIVNAELHYYVPGVYGNMEKVVKAKAPITYTDDKSQALMIDGDIDILFRLAEVKRYDEEREKAFEQGDEKATIMWIKKIIEVYTDLQKPTETKAYTDMLNEYMRSKKISRAVLNKATSSSSQAQVSGILEDLEEEEFSQFTSKMRMRRKH